MSEHEENLRLFVTGLDQALFVSARVPALASARLLIQRIHDDVVVAHAEELRHVYREEYLDGLIAQHAEDGREREG